MELLRATLLLFRTHFRRLFFSKRTAFCALIALAPTGLSCVVLGFDEGPPPLDVIVFPTWMLMFQIVVPLTSLIMGSAVISEEIDDRTITYLFTRPFPRAALLLGRWLATALVLAVVLGVGAVLHTVTVELLADIDVPTEMTRPIVEASILGGAAYSALFASLGTFLKRPMIVGLGYAFVIEGILANMPGKNQGLALVHHLRSFVADYSEHWAQVRQGPFQELGTAHDAVVTLVSVIAVALIVGSLVVTRRQYVVTS